MNMVLALSAALARRKGLEALSFRWSRLLAAAVIHGKGIGPSRNLADLGRSWQRGFPSARQVPIEAITADTVYARIETPCPLRGSGWTAACWRMMEYDRAVAQAAGGQFVVLQSQAEPGVMTCRVALRRIGETTDDLPPAHIRAPDIRATS
jgi:hypothetical protein